MPYDHFTARLKAVAEACENYARTQYGRNGFKIDEQISDTISWKPTFFHKPTSVTIHAYEVAEVLYPTALKIAAHDILTAKTPISVFLVCPLDLYLADHKQETVRKLHNDGFGIITVDDLGNVTEQKSCCPLAQNIPNPELENAIRGLTPSLKVHFRRAHNTYITNAGQGLQMCGQIVEGIVGALGTGAETRCWIPTGSLAGKMAADTIDLLYPIAQFQNHRAALGGARHFVRQYRNTASHAPKTAAEAVSKIHKCKAGFLEAATIAGNLLIAGQALGIRTTLHVT